MQKKHYFYPLFKTGAFLLIAFALILGACAPAAVAEPVEEAVQEVEEQPAAQAAVAAQSFIDAVGNEIVIDSVPTSIVSLAPSITEALYAIGAGELVTGRTEYCNFPEEALDVPVVGGFSESEISTEMIVDIEPDLVIGGSVYQAEVVDALTRTGMTAFIQEPGSVEEIMDAMELHGSVTGYLDTTAEAIEDMQTRIDAVVEIATAIPGEERVTVFYEVWHDPYMTTSSQTFIGELITMAGGINIFADLEEEYPSISAEEIIDSDPKIIIGPSSHEDQLTVEMIGSREGWSDISAVKDERIYVVDGDIVSRAGPRVVDALEAFALVMYPEYFGE